MPILFINAKPQFYGFYKQSQISEQSDFERNFEFAIQIVQYAELLDSNKKYVISKQVIRSGTSIGANVKEAQNAESKADFIHKLKIALKEADETEYWLFLCRSLNYSNPEILIQKLNAIIKILNKIIATSKSKRIV